MKKLLLIFATVATLLSCTVQERIFFDANMGGTYKSSFDLSSMMAVINKGGASNAQTSMPKMDTVVVFSDLLEQYKDSIATLPAEEQAKLASLKGMRMLMKMDAELNIFEFTAIKEFTDFSEIANVSDQMDEVFNMAKSKGVGATTAGPGTDMLKTDKVLYTFENNTFRRVDKKLLKADGIDEDVEESEEEDNMLKGMLGEFDDLLEESTMTLVYTFPKKVISVSKKDAIVSEDGKTVTYSIDWKSLMEDESILENFEVELEQE